MYELNQSFLMAFQVYRSDFRIIVAFRDAYRKPTALL